MCRIQDIVSTIDRPGGDRALRGLALLHGAAVIGRFDAVEALIRLARERGETAERLEEAALQVVAYGGFPRALETLRRLAAGREGPPRSDALDRRSPDQAATDGRSVWDQVYADAAEPVLAELEGLLPGLSRRVLDDAYGRILSRPGLTLGEREILGVAALALVGLRRPLASHILGALRNGFAPSAVQDILHTCSVLAGARVAPVIAQAIDRITRKVFRS